MAAFFALVPTLIVVQRSVPPADVPVPLLDGRELARAERQDEEDAAAARREGLDLDVRELGSAIRTFGTADAAGDEIKAAAARQRLAVTAGPALRIGGEAVRRLRAFQLRSFLDEVRRWENGGEPSADLLELGGGFVRMLQRNGWVEQRGSRREVLLGTAALRASFKLRWNEVADLRAPELDVPLEQRRALLAFMLEHPLAPPGGTGGRPARPDFRAAYEGQYTLRKIDELAAIDPDYPASLARGVVLYRLGRFGSATKAFQEHLEARPDGPYTLRARNYLKEAIERSGE